ncbi:MAG: HNH endonuclease [Allosphingosinicella sp.]
MGKRFRGKICAYCGGAGVTADHIFARKFFPVEHRGNLPQISACAPCNRAKSHLEHYLLSVLPFGGRNKASNAILEREVPRRLAKNRKLYAELAQGRRDVLLRENDQLHSTLTLPFESDKLSALFAFIAKGLASFSWNVVIPPNYFVGAGFLSREAEQVFERFMMHPSRRETRGNLGDGIILYQGVQAIADECRTLWRFRLYGGILFGGDPKAESEMPSNIWASTSRLPVLGFSESNTA